MVSTYSFPIFGKDTFSAKHIPKSGINGIPNLGPFPLPSNHTLYTSLTIGCRREKLRPYLTHLPCYFCLFSNFHFFLLHVFFVAFALFYSVSLCSFFLHVFLAVVALFHTMFVIFFGMVFLSFTQFLLLILSTIPCFFPPCFSILGLTSILLYQKDLGHCGPNNLYWIKRVLDPICLNLPNSFCKRFVFYCK